MVHNISFYIIQFTISSSRKRKHKSHKKHKNSLCPEKEVDAVKHGGWWSVKKLEDINGPVCIEFGNQTYVKALDNGLFTLGAPHGEGWKMYLVKLNSLLLH